MRIAKRRSHQEFRAPIGSVLSHIPQKKLRCVCPAGCKSTHTLMFLWRQAPGFQRAGTPIKLNTSAFSHLQLDPRVNVAVVLIRRGPRGVTLRYMGHNATIPYETWSSSKIFAAASAAGVLQERCGLGLAGETRGVHGATPLGDLLTIICSYDTTVNYTSNGLARYFLDVGGRPRVRELVQRWLGRVNETLGGNYGEPVPSDLAFGVQENNGEWCPEEPNHTDDGDISNSLSALGAAEFARRLILHRESSADLRLPGVEWSDVASILYGANHTKLFPAAELRWGGMSTDTSIFLQRSVGETALARAGDQWRIFSKLGAGFSDTRQVGEITNIAYGCFPVLDSTGTPVVDEGLELVITSRASIPVDTKLITADKVLLDTLQSVVTSIVEAQ